MIIFPAIDLKGGKCVRLEQGDMARATTFNDSPAEQAQTFFEQGFTHLHIVDLDGAFAGNPVNAKAVEEICAQKGAYKQLGGGIRDIATIEKWFTHGIDRVILGTAAVRDPDFVKQACRLFPERIVVGIDARAGRVAVAGWAEESTLAATDLALRFEDCGVAAIIFTDIDRDGLLTGVNVEATTDLARAVNVPIIASGGLSGISDIEALLPFEADGVHGAISGRALYDGRLDPKAVLALPGVS